MTSGRADSAFAQARAAGEAAVSRLARFNEPGRMSLAGAYALGYGTLGLAQIDDDGPDWYNLLDPLDTLMLGTAFPKRFASMYEFANARDRVAGAVARHRSRQRHRGFRTPVPADQ